MKRFVLLLALGLASPAFTFAQEESSSSTYVGLKLGPIVPKADDLQGFDNGLAIEGVVGFRASENIALELGVGRFGMSASESGYVDIGGYLYPATITVDVVAYPVTGTAKFLMPMDKAQLYGLVGGGIYFMTAEATLDVQGYVPETINHSETPFALHIGGGLDFSVSPNTRIGAEVRYVIGKVDMWGDGTKYNFDSVIITGGLTYSL
jgi:opacity protein-like surface antigen